MPYMIQQHKVVTEADKELLDGLTRAGFKLNGEGTSGLFVKYWCNSGVRRPTFGFSMSLSLSKLTFLSFPPCVKGYYVDVGCSQLIIDGKVKIKQGQEIEHFEKTGVRFKDGSFLEADVVVLATGMLYCFLSYV